MGTVHLGTSRLALVGAAPISLASFLTSDIGDGMPSRLKQYLQYWLFNCELCVRRNVHVCVRGLDVGKKKNRMRQTLSARSLLLETRLFFQLNNYHMTPFCRPFQGRGFSYQLSQNGTSRFVSTFRLEVLSDDTIMCRQRIYGVHIHPVAGSLRGDQCYKYTNLPTSPSLRLPLLA
ncbi:hypothetical protein EDD18DRAFT_342535 [Armillaria luteobubalina]|uniref:Uncharacterized protein n=1 Tax=Armillaria luteobubalina TaxID=153913 RepID=A0AA39UVC3_9AGAR|nr:hypothetical protein EDD18DRAFT_342535 [Armillaria luteobubalina]